MGLQFVILIFLMFIEICWPAVVINEINANVPLHRKDGEEFLELKETDPCLFKRLSSNESGPSLNGYYIAMISNNPFELIVTVNLSAYSFKKSSPYFVIGHQKRVHQIRHHRHHGNNQTQLANMVGIDFDIGTGLQRQKIFWADRNISYSQRNFFPNGNDSMIGVALLYTNESNIIRRFLWSRIVKRPTKDNSTGMNNVTIAIVKRYMVDFAVYSGGYPHGRHFFANFETKYFWDPELVLYDQETSDEYKTESLDLSVSRCLDVGGTEGFHKAFDPKQMKLALPSPGRKNNCNGAFTFNRTIYENSGLQGAPRSAEEMVEFRDIEFHYSQKDSFNHQTRECEKKVEVDWTNMVSGNCQTDQEVLTALESKFSKQKVVVVKEFIRDMKEHMPLELIPVQALKQYKSEIEKPGSTSTTETILAGTIGTLGGTLLGALLGVAGMQKCMAAGAMTTLGSLASAATSMGSSAVDQGSDAFDFMDEENALDETNGGDGDSSSETNADETNDDISQEEGQDESDDNKNEDTEEEEEEEDDGDDDEDIPPEGAKCMLQEEGIRNENVPYSECDEAVHTELGQLMSVKNLLKIKLADNNPHNVDAENEVDLILSRGAGLFFNDYSNPGVLEQVEGKYFCKKHVLKFGSDWHRAAKVIHRTRKAGSARLACGMHPEKTGQAKKVAAKKNSFLTKAQSEAMLYVRKIFYPIGTPLCVHHHREVQECVTEFIAENMGHCLRPRPRPHLAGAPKLQKGESIGSNSCSQDEDPDFEPNGQEQYTEVAMHSADTSEFRELLDKLIALTQLTKINYPRNFGTLSVKRQRKLATTLRKLQKAIYSAVIPGDEEESIKSRSKLEEMISTLRLTGSYSGTHLGLDKTLTVLSELYDNAKSRDEKYMILGIAASSTTKTHLSKFFPPLSDYIFTKAKKYAVTFAYKEEIYPSNMQNRIRYDECKVHSFIEFIVSPAIISDLPFGKTHLTFSDGTKKEISTTVRKLCNKRIIIQYSKYLVDRDQSDLWLCERTYYNILDACSAKTRKSQFGIDSFTYAGEEGFQDLSDVVDTIMNHGADYEQMEYIKAGLKDGRVYLKTDYQHHVILESRVADHCFAFSLSDPRHHVYSKGCINHHHDQFCDRCDNLKDVLKSLQDHVNEPKFTIPAELQQCLKFIVSSSIEAITNWKAHIMRTVYQNIEKQKILDTMDENKAFITMDWAMKHNPSKGREPQSDWFGKRGLSWHITVVHKKQSGTNVWMYRAFVHVFERSTQSSTAVTAILKHVLQELHQEMPFIDGVYIRSDNAGCYKSAPTMASVPPISRETRINVLRWTFSEAQSGKGPCDRLAGAIKNHIYRYVAENREMTDGSEFLKAVSSYNGIKATSFYHCTIPNEDDNQGDATIEGIFQFYEFLFKNEKMRTWNFHEIGTGADVAPRKWTRRGNTAQLQVISAVHETALEKEESHNLWAILGHHKRKNEGNGLDEFAEAEINSEQKIPGFIQNAAGSVYICPEEGCAKVFAYYHHYAAHVELEMHDKKTMHETLLDCARVKFRDLLEMKDILQSIPELNLAYEEIENSGRKAQVQMSQGWALRKPREHKVFNPNQVSFLQNLFNQGAKTNHKITPKDAAKSMRDSRNIDGTLRFTAAEYLTEIQIRALFSRWSSAAKQKRDRRTLPQSHQMTSEETQNIELLDNIYVDIDQYENNFPDISEEESAYDYVMSIVEGMSDELTNSC